MNTTSATFVRSVADFELCPEPTLPEFAFAGRSNVGKSSLLNLLVGKRDLAKVSATPGHTKHLNFFDIAGHWRLVDCPGYGYAKVEREERGRFSQLVADYLANRPNLECVFTLIDSSLPPQALDLEFIDWLSDHEVPFVLVFTKIDRASSDKVQEHMDAMKALLSERFENLPEIYTTSSIERRGRSALLKVIESTVRPRKKSKETTPKRSPRNTPW